jgi:hypothetical protein
MMETLEVTSVAKSRFSIDAILMNKRLSNEPNATPMPEGHSVKVTPTQETNCAESRSLTDFAEGVSPSTGVGRRSATPNCGSSLPQHPHRASPELIKIGISSHSGCSPLDLTNHSTMLSQCGVAVRGSRAAIVQPHRDLLSGLRDAAEYCSAYSRESEHLFTGSQRYDDSDDVIDVETVRLQVPGAGFRPVAPGHRRVYSGEDDSDICSGE